MYPLIQCVVYCPRHWGLLIFLCIGSIQLSFAQSSHQIFEHISTDHGLSSNKVEAILQDRDGFYWIATQNGLNRFDGTSFRVFLHNKDDSTSLTHNYCTGLHEDQRGNIWVATYKGISLFKKDKGSFQQIYLEHPTKNFEITNRIHNLAIDGDGNMWIAGNGLWKYDFTKDTILSVEPAKSALTPAYHLITQLVYDPQLNGLWFTSGFTLIFYSISDNSFYFEQNNPYKWKVFEHADNVELTLDKKNLLWFRTKKEQVLAYFDSRQNQVTLTNKKIVHGVKKISPDDQNRIWILYWQAAAEIYDPGTGLTDSEFFAPHHRRSANSKQATCLFIDKQQNHWIGSGNGISIYNHVNQYYRLYELAISEDPYGEPIKINSMAQTNPGKLWIATNRGLFDYDLRNGKSRLVYLDPAVASITTLLADSDKVWLGIYDHLLCFDTKSESIIEKLPLKPGIFFIRKGNGNELWIGLWVNGLFYLNKSTNEIERFYVDSTAASTIRSNSLITGYNDGPDFWIGYNAGMGFSKYNRLSNSWQHFHPQETDRSSSNAGTITVITKDHLGDFWLGTHGAGVFRFDPEKLTYDHYEQINGLKSNYINSIIPDGKGSLWISTADGMNYMKIANKSIRSPDMDLAFPSNDFAPNGITGLDSMLYFYCKNSFVVINPAEYDAGNAIPRLVISSFKIFDVESNLVNDTTGINLTYRQNFFSFEFSAIKPHPYKEVAYAYLLEGFDPDWKIVSHQPVASYTNVPEGKYIFKVRAMNDEGQWSNALLNIPVHIKPPFWRTWWFALLAIALIISAIYAFYRYRIEHIKKIFAVRTKISRDLHDDIGSTLSSIHFYSSVAEKEVSHDPKKAKEYLKQINRNSRQIIENIGDIVWANNTDQKDTSSLSGRIKNYGYGLLSQNNIECKYAIDEQAEKKLTNPEARRNILLIIKEALNNIAKYSEADFAEVRMMLNGSHLLLDIADNGKGFDVTSTKNGHGLNNMKKRAASLGGVLDIRSVADEGTSIHCRIPLPNISDI